MLIRSTPRGGSGVLPQLAARRLISARRGMRGRDIAGKDTTRARIRPQHFERARDSLISVDRLIHLNGFLTMRKTTLLLTTTLLAAACNGVPIRQHTKTMNVPPLEAHSAPVASIDAEHYGLTLRLDPVGRAIEGQLELLFVSRKDNLARVTLDFEELNVHNVLDSNGRDLAYFQKDGKLIVALDETLALGAAEQLKISYAGVPKKGLWFTDMEQGVATQVFTQGECEDSRWWFPCVDNPADRATSELTVTMPMGWSAVAAGELVERKELNGSAVEHWRMNFPHPVYLTTLVAGDFAVELDEWDGVPLIYMGDTKYASSLKESFASTKSALDFLSDVTGLRYPYAKYAQSCVDDFPFGGMENISATTMTDTMLLDARGLVDGDSTGLIVHEAAHQWFGDLMTCNSWDHIWLNEGFATYMTQLYYESVEGNDSFRMRWYDSLNGYLSSDVGKDRRPTVYNTYRDPMDLFFGGQTYAGGAARLHYLRFTVGDKAFFEGVKTYVADNQGRGVTTPDLQTAMEKASGQDLTGFFDQWLYGEGYPEINVDWSWSERDSAVKVTVQQTQREVGGTPAVFELPVDILVHTAKGTVTHRVVLNERKQSFTLASDMTPSYIWFDEGGWLPAKVTREKKPGEWLELAASSESALSRRLAIEALGDSFAGGNAFDLRTDQKEFTRAELVNRLRQDKSSWVRSAAAKALGQDGSEEARLRLMAAASTDRNTHVRKAAFSALEGWGEDLELASFAHQEYDAGFSWRSMGAAARLIASSDPKGIFQWTLRELFDADSPHEVLRRDLLGVMSGLSHSRVQSQLVQWATDSSAGSGARIAAVKSIGKLDRLDRETRRTLVELLHADNARLRRAAVGSLTKFNDAISKTALRDYYATTVSTGEKRTIEAAFER